MQAPERSSPPASRPGGRSIRRALLSNLMLPLIAVVLMVSIGAHAMASYFAQQVLDQWLYDSAQALARQVQPDGGRLRLDLSHSAFDILGFDVVDNVYFRVVGERSGELLANAPLQPPLAESVVGGRPHYFDAAIDGKPVRAVALRVGTVIGEEVTVVVAETRGKRNAWTARVFGDALVLSTAMALACALVIWYAIGSGVRQLERVVRDIRAGGRDAPIVRVDVPVEMRPLVDELDALLAERAESHRSYQRFVGNAAHQLRTPLASLLVQLDLARGESDAQRLKAMLNQARSDVQRLGHLLHQLLTLARVEEGTGLDLEPTDLDAVARALVEERIDAATQRGIDLGYQAPQRAVVVPAKAALLREVLDNLVDNAMRYAPESRRITVGVLSDPPTLFVDDEGPGIPAAEHDRVKERFVRLPGAAGEGCGLGLAIVDEIARRHRARLVLATPPGSEHGLRAALVFDGAVSGDLSHSASTMAR